MIFNFTPASACRMNCHLSIKAYSLPQDLQAFKHVGTLLAYHYLLGMPLNMSAIYGCQKSNLRISKINRLTNCRLSKYSVRKDTAFGPCKNIRRTIPSGLFKQGVQKSVNKKTNKRLSGDHPLGVNIGQRASRKSLTIKTQTKPWRVLRCAKRFVNFYCAGVQMRNDNEKNIALKDDSHVGPRLSCSSRGAAF